MIGALRPWPDLKILVFKVNQLGDNVVFLPVVQALHSRHPGWELVLLTTPVAAPLYEGVRTILTPKDAFNNAWKKPWKLAELFLRLRKEKADASLIADDQSNVAHLLALLAGGAVRVGTRRPFIKLKKSVTHAVRIEAPERVATLNWETGRTLALALGDADWPARPPAPDLGHLLGDVVPAAGRVIIHPGASKPYQRWFPERFAQLADRLAERSEVFWIDEAGGVELSPAVKRVSPASLKEFVRLLGSASLFVGNNSGPMHLASALGRPSVILNGPSNPAWDPFWHSERFLMLRDGSLPCLPCDPFPQGRGGCTNFARPMACMKSWSVDAVHELCRSWIAKF